MKFAPAFAAAYLLIASTEAYALSNAERSQLTESLERIRQRQRDIEQDIASIQRLLGIDSPTQGLAPLKPAADASERLRTALDEGIKSYEAKEYEKAKESFQKALEEDPNNHAANFNLGLAYDRLGNTALAKRMLKIALELQPKMEHADLLQNYLQGSPSKEIKKEAVTASPAAEEKPELKALRTEMINLQKEVDSYIRSNTLAEGRKRSEVAAKLKAMIAKAQSEDLLVKEYFVGIGERYRDIQHYAEALEAFQRYEKSMAGEVLADGYHATVLQVREKQQAQETLFNSYLGKSPDKSIQKLIQKDQDELAIFASQMQEFVGKPSKDDADFKKICKRLAEYRWGNRPGRHVLVINADEEILYSSLEGTAAIDRYQDAEGKKFLQNIVQLGDRLQEKTMGYTEIKLRLQNRDVPYVLIFARIPKHNSFIIVRYPKDELSAQGSSS